MGMNFVQTDDTKIEWYRYIIFYYVCSGLSSMVKTGPRWTGPLTLAPGKEFQGNISHTLGIYIALWQKKPSAR
jgi:hypothetical protein